MCPDISKESIAFVKEVTNINELEEGKIYVYRTFDVNKSIYIHHRLIEIFGSLAEFKGDNNYNSEYVDVDSILYKYLFEIPLIKCKEEDIRNTKLKEED